MLACCGVQAGSAPRVRGTGSFGLATELTMRFSPARAGNRQAGRLCPLPAAVQPRACGEQSRRVPTFVGGHGSAPRVRGTAPVARRSCRRRRFSPARAGNRSRGKTRAITRPVQPRACGEQRGGEFRDYWKCGSAPRVRGTGSTGQCQTRRQRFSPARAGNSRAHPHLGTRRAVQPRACGEQPTKAAPSSSANGSAPRVRGTGRSVHVRMGWRRFSPARAGNRPAASSRRQTSTVQPRACGEQCTAFAASSCGRGSAPRVRGTEHGNDPWTVP